MNSYECEECGKNFANPGRLFVHQKKSCRDGKRSLRELLSDARTLWKSIEEGPRKRQKMLESKTATEHSPQPCSQGRHGVGHRNLEAVAPFRRTQSPIPSVESTAPDQASITMTPGECLFQSEQVQAPAVDLSQTADPSFAKDMFGMFKQFDGRPISHNPDVSSQDRGQKTCALGSVSDGPAGFVPDTPAPTSSQFHPYPNWSSFELGDLFWNHGSTNSLDRFKDLITLMRHPEFSIEDVRQANWNQINNQLAEGKQIGLDDDVEWIDDIGPGWTTTKITIRVPFSNKGRNSKFGLFDAGVLHHRRIVSVIKEQLADAVQHPNRHYQAFQLLWQPDGSKEPIRVYNEVYSSEEFRKMEEEVRGLALGPEDDGCERVVIALMFWSDATLLASFGSAKLWPCYLFFGNDSKYLRAKPSTGLCNHIAYFESLPASFKDWYRATNGRSPTPDLVTHCTREIFHRQWDILLDDDLLQAMKIFTYSADYPEKAMIGTIKAMGTAPCPRCLMKKCEIHGMGSPDDALARITNSRTDNHERQEKVRLARDKIFQEGYTVDSKKVDELLKEESMVPVDNAFSKLNAIGFDVYSTLVVDLMHEFELGVWKAIFIHLIRILEADDRVRKTSVVNELDRRYRAIPLFGPDKIRRFSANASEQKKLAARDYANLLQCAMPVFDGLLPEPHNAIVQKLLFLLGDWHALAKLRMHTDHTVAMLEATTSELAGHLRTFIDVTCQAFETVETNKEYKARLKRSAKKKDNAVSDQLSNPPIELAVPHEDANRPTENQPELSGSASTEPGGRPANTSPGITPEANVSSTSTPASKSKIRKVLNLQTYKYHALGDYAHHIRRFGTTDSYSTERGEFEHKLPKSWFWRTNKKAYRRQLARIERRRRNLRKIRQKGGKERPMAKKLRDLKASSTHGRFCSYVIAKSQSVHQPLSDFLPVDGVYDDPALKDFLPTLQEHLCQRMKVILQQRHPHRFAEVLGETSMDKSFVSLIGERIYSHKTLHLWYTAYDCSEGSDIVWPAGSKASIMMLNPAYPATGAHPFIYGKVIKIFHANVVYVKGFQDLPPERLDFLWVRWYTWLGKSGGTYGMDIINFPHVHHRDAFGFVDPGDVLRACHIIPRFSAPALQRMASFSKIAEDQQDHAAYFVNHLADRDMSMRYRWGFAVGHTYTHKLSHVEAPSTNTEGVGSLTYRRDDESQRNGGQCIATQGRIQDAVCDEDEMVYDRSDVESDTSDEELGIEDESDEELA